MRWFFFLLHYFYAFNVTFLSIESPTMSGAPSPIAPLTLARTVSPWVFFAFTRLRVTYIHPRPCAVKRTLRFFWIPRWLQVLVWCQLRRKPSQFSQLLLWPILHPREMPGLWCCFLWLLQYVNFPFPVLKSDFWPVNSQSQTAPSLMPTPTMRPVRLRCGPARPTRRPTILLLSAPEIFESLRFRSFSKLPCCHK